MDLIDKIVIEEEKEYIVTKEIVTDIVYVYLNVIEKECKIEEDCEEDCINTEYEAEIKFNKKIYRCNFDFNNTDHHAYIDYQKKITMHTLCFSEKEIKDYIIKEILKNKEARNMVMKTKHKTHITKMPLFQYKVFFNENYGTWEDFEVNDNIKELIRQIEEQEYIEEQMKNF